jgi:hypothetical protein
VGQHFDSRRVVRPRLGVWIASAVVGSALLVSACGASAKATAPALYVAPTGSDTAACTQSAPCATLQRAYTVAKPGQTVLIQPGAYPPQLVAFVPKTGDPVVFAGTNGASVASIDLGNGPQGIRGPQHVVIRDLVVGMTTVWDGSSDVELRNLHGRGFDIIYGASTAPMPDNVRVIGGDFGPCEATSFAGGCTVRLIGTNLLVDGAHIHNVTSRDLGTYHVDGIFIRGCRGCTVRRSVFFGNMITNIRVQNCCELPPNQNITIENNWFAPPLQGDGATPRTDAIDFDDPVPGLVVRNNSFAENAGPAFGRGDWNGTNARIANNLMLNFPCVAGVTYSHNVFIPFSRDTGNRPCGPTDRQVGSFGYTNGPALDYHLVPSSPAIGHADASSCPALDIDGRVRSKDVKCDVGADQRRDTPACKRVGTKKHPRFKTVWISGIWLQTQPHPGLTGGRCRTKHG